MDQLEQDREIVEFCKKSLSYRKQLSGEEHEVQFQLTCSAGVFRATKCTYYRIECLGRHLGLGKQWRVGAREKIAKGVPNFPRFANTKIACTAGKVSASHLSLN